KWRHPAVRRGATLGTHEFGRGFSGARRNLAGHVKAWPRARRFRGDCRPRTTVQWRPRKHGAVHLGSVPDFHLARPGAARSPAPAPPLVLCALPRHLGRLVLHVAADLLTACMSGGRSLLAVSFDTGIRSSGVLRL